MLTGAELIKLREEFSQAGKEKQVNLLKVANPENARKETETVSHLIPKFCETCPYYGPSPIKIKVFFLLREILFSIMSFSST